VSASSSIERTVISGRVGPVLGVDIGGSTVKSVVIAEGRIEARFRVPRDRPIADLLHAVVGRVLDEHEVMSVGVGLAGLVDHAAGRYVWGPHLADTDIDVASILDGLVDAHVVDNDANCAAYGEWIDGPAHGHRVALTVSVGTGIGAGLVVDGAIWRGSAFAGEVGHMTMTESGLECRCGGAGCWETLVSGRRLELEAGRLGIDGGAEGLAAAAGGGWEPAADALRVAGHWLGLGITNLILMLDPSIVVVAGGVSDAGSAILDAAREQIASGLPGAGHRTPVQLAQAAHGRWAAAVGAAHLAARIRAGDRGTIRGDIEE
jgi:glucokinase